MKTLLLIIASVIMANAFASGVPDIDVCGTLVTKGKNWNGTERLERVLNVRNEKMSINEFVTRYCQGEPASSTETCSRAHRVASIDMAVVSREMPKGLCKK